MALDLEKEKRIWKTENHSLFNRRSIPKSVEHVDLKAGEIQNLINGAVGTIVTGPDGQPLTDDEGRLTAEFLTARPRTVVGEFGQQNVMTVLIPPARIGQMYRLGPSR